MREGIEALRQALGIVEPVDADDQPAAGEAHLEALHLADARGVGRAALDMGGVDAYGVGLDPERTLERPNRRSAPGFPHAGVGLDNEIAAEMPAVRLRLEADEIERGKTAHQLVVHRQGRQQLPGRQGGVEEEAHPVREAEPPQFLGEGNQMVIVGPDHVVGAQQAGQLAGEFRVDAPIAGVISAVEIDQIDAVMEQRPERRVGEAVVILLVVAFAEIHGGAGKPSALGQLHGLAGNVDDLAAPAEPDTPGTSQRGKHGDGQTARGGPSFVYRRDPVRNDDDAIGHKVR